MNKTDPPRRARTFTISDLARELALTPRTIRHYEEQGLLRPQREGANRVFTERDRARLKLIVRSSEAGFSLLQIKGLFDIFEQSLDDGPSMAEFRAKLESWRETLRHKRAQIDLLLDEIDFFDRQCDRVSAR
jgi:DNA-binding transcriptional MerR regulator